MCNQRYINLLGWYTSYITNPFEKTMERRQFDGPHNTNEHVLVHPDNAYSRTIVCTHIRQVAIIR